jgi:hypothetical protein
VITLIEWVSVYRLIGILVEICKAGACKNICFEVSCASVHFCMGRSQRANSSRRVRCERVEKSAPRNRKVKIIREVVHFLGFDNESRATEQYTICRSSVIDSEVTPFSSAKVGRT